MISVKRMPPWDLDSDLWEKLHMIKVREQRPWRWMLSKGVELFIEWYEAKTGVVKPLEAITPPATVRLAQKVEARPAAALPALNVEERPAAAPVVSVPQTEAEKEVARLTAKVERTRAEIETAKAKLLLEPADFFSLQIMKFRPPQLIKEQGWLDEALETLRVEREALSSYLIDNGEKEETCGESEGEGS